MDAIVGGFITAFSPENLLYCFAGVFFGTFIGVLPGIGSLAAVSMLLPITYYLPPTAAIIMLAGIYYGAQYGGSIASILLNLPGGPSSAVVCLDGYPMARQGRAGVALLMTTVASFFGGCVGIVALAAFGPQLARFGLSFGAAEYFSMMLLGLVASGTIASGSAVKGLAMVVFGVALGLVGTDINTGVHRYTFGLGFLYEGVPMVAFAMGVFGLSEVIASVRESKAFRPAESKITLKSMMPTREDVRRSVMPILRGTGLGTFFGTLPGTGVTIASFMAYVLEKRVSREPSRFGKGAIEGVTSPEAANNAAAQTSFIPTLTLGIPGDATMALLMAALMIHELQPGPRLIVEHPDLFWAVIASFWIGNIFLVILNIPLIGIWVRLVRIPYSILYPSIILFVCLGVYSVNGNPSDLIVVAAFGALGHGMRLVGFEAAPLLVGFILGPMIEENLRRALVISRGDPTILVSRPISAAFLALAIGLVAWGLYSTFRRRRSRGTPEIAVS